MSGRRHHLPAFKASHKTPAPWFMTSGPDIRVATFFKQYWMTNAKSQCFIRHFLRRNLLKLRISSGGEDRRQES